MGLWQWLRLLLLALAATQNVLSGREGLVDSTFDPGAGPNRLVTALAMQGTKILVGGDFTTVAGTERFRLARLNPDGGVDPTFTATFGEAVGSVAVQADGRVLVGGTFSVVNGQQRRGLVRLLPDGALDSSFIVGSGVDGSVNAFAIQPDGRILAGGNFETVNGTPSKGLVRLNGDGTVDDTFVVGAGVTGGQSITGGVYAITLQRYGWILIGGDFTAVDGVA